MIPINDGSSTAIDVVVRFASSGDGLMLVSRTTGGKRMRRLLEAKITA